MATTIDYGSDYGGGAGDYQTTMAENPSGTIDYDGLTRGKLCPLKGNRPPVLGFWNLDPAPIWPQR